MMDNTLLAKRFLFIALYSFKNTRMEYRLILYDKAWKAFISRHYPVITSKAFKYYEYQQKNSTHLPHYDLFRR